MIEQTFVNLLRLDEVKRWHTIVTSREQTVAGHSFRVAVIAIELMGRLGIPVTLGLLMSALFHDAGEDVTGDIPPEGKKYFVAINTVNLLLPAHLDPPPNDMVHEHFIVKAADLIEAHLFVQDNGLGQHSVRAAEDVRCKLIKFLEGAETKVKGITAASQEIINEALG